MNNLSSIILYWPPGSWKSTTAVELSQALDIPHYDTDQLIERQHWRMQQLIKERWETYFREIESTVMLGLCDIMENQRVIVSLWGWSLLRRENLWFIQQTWAMIFALTWGLDTLYERIQRDNSRPLMQTRYAFDEIMQERQVHYSEFPHIIQIDRKTPTQIAQEIQEKLKERNLCLL